MMKVKSMAIRIRWRLSAVTEIQTTMEKLMLIEKETD